MNAREWIDAFAAEIGAEPPTADEIKQILDLAAVAAHSSERIAAPVACWVGGAVRSPRSTSYRRPPSGSAVRTLGRRNRPTASPLRPSPPASAARSCAAPRLTAGRLVVGEIDDHVGVVLAEAGGVAAQPFAV